RPDDLAALAPEAWPALDVRPVRSLRLVATSAPVDDARERLLRGEELGDVPRATLWLRVWRQGWQVFHRRVDELEFAALDWLRGGGVTFADLCEWLAARVGDDAAAGEALKLL